MLCTYNVILWHVRVMFIPPHLSQPPDTISLEEWACMSFNVDENNNTDLDLRIKCPILCLILTKSGVIRQIFIKFLTSSFEEILSLGSRVCTCTDTNRRTDRETEGRKGMTKANRSFSRLCEHAEKCEGQHSWPFQVSFQYLSE